MRPHRKLVPMLIFFLALPLSMACGARSLISSALNLPPTPSLSDEPTGSSPMSGDWNADTDFGHFAFTVDPDGVKITTAVVKVAGFTCGGTYLSTEPQELSQWPITDGEFAGRVNLGDADEILDMTFDGTYDPASKTFSGSWEEDAHGTHCTGDWQTLPHK